MGLVKIKISRDGYKCERCFHEWVPRANTPANPPKTCPKCGSPYWNVPRKEKKKVKNVV
jgi:Zn finger protein HypA/HybF involved in hydrogenase expression